MRAISYALFGAEREKPDNCFSFDSYLTGLMLSIRFNRLVYPSWITVLETDQSTFNAYHEIFNALREQDIIKIEVNPDGAKLCEAMLWRLKPAFWENHDGSWMFDHVICRDLDSLSTYRDAQAVQMWVNSDKTMHAITDSVSHDRALLGGMIGVKPKHFTNRMGANSFQGLMNQCKIDLSNKGSDQDFLNRIVYPRVAEKGNDSITQHYFKGHGKTWLSDWHSCECWRDACRVGHKKGCPLDTPLPLDEEMKETNEIAEHMGASGWNQQQTMRLVHKHADKFKDLEEIEKNNKDIFTWIR